MEFLDLMPVFLLLTFFFSTFVFWVVYKRIQFHVWKLPPGPIGFPFLGYAPFIVGKEVHTEFNRLFEIFGPLFSITLGSYSVVIVSDYERAKELLSHPSCLARPPKFFDALPEKGGIVGFSGSIWVEQRRLCAYSLNKMGRGNGIWEKVTQKDVDEIVEYIQGFGDRPVDFSSPLSRSVRCSVLGLLLGKQFTEKETNPDVQVMEKGLRIITELFQTTNPAVLIPWMLKYLVKFNIAGYAEKMKAIDEFDNLFRSEVKKRRNGEGHPYSPGFIGYYVEVLSKQASANKSESKNHMVQNLTGNLLAIFFGGTNTTVASLLWLFILMAAFPEVQTRVHEEIDKEIASDEDVKWDDRKKLPYTMATILEMQRWASVLPFYTPRCVSETFEFRGYKLPKGTMIIANGWAIHHDSNYWENPQLFTPERFIRPSDTREKDPVRLDGFAPFSFGKRNCPGETLAVMTLFLYFAGLMQKFTVKSPPGLQVDIRRDFRSVIYPKEQELCFVRRK